MGSDKSKMLVGGVPAAIRLARELRQAFGHVTVLGREPIEGYAFFEDSADYEGPLSALARFEPSADWVFVCSCDLPLATAQDFRALWSLREPGKALVPLLNGRLQPLCAFYPSSSFESFRQLSLSEVRSMMAALDSFDRIEVRETKLASKGIRPSALLGANTQDAWERLLKGETS